MNNRQLVTRRLVLIVPPPADLAHLFQQTFGHIVGRGRATLLHVSPVTGGINKLAKLPDGDFRNSHGERSIKLNLLLRPFFVLAAAF